MHGNVPWKPQHEGFLFFSAGDSRERVEGDFEREATFMEFEKLQTTPSKLMLTGRSLPNYNRHIRACKFTDYLEIHPGRKAGCPARLSGDLFRVKHFFTGTPAKSGAPSAVKMLGQSNAIEI